MAKSATDKIRELDAQRAKLIAAAKSEAINKVRNALNDLNNLGFDYRLVGEDANRILARKPSRGKGKVKNGPCKICKFVTVPPHDARTHRAQTRKAPFTSQELVERGLRRG